MWFIDVEVEQEMSATPPKKNPGSSPEQIVHAIFELLLEVSEQFKPLS